MGLVIDCNLFAVRSVEQLGVSHEVSVPSVTANCHVQAVLFGNFTDTGCGWTVRRLHQVRHAIAEKIAGLETELMGEEGVAKSFRDSETQLRKSVSQTEANLKRLKQQVDTVKATEIVQRSQAAVAARHSGAGSSMGSAVDSLERLKNKQAERAAKFEAASELADSTEEVSLDAKLKAAGIVDGGASGGDVLARLRAKRSA